MRLNKTSDSRNEINKETIESVISVLSYALIICWLYAQDSTK